ncbi:MAG: exodeoxyribonuclease VII large subunit [Treponema sp.]|nr:exodeoxyribonuclease VII large subunit [Treponema sp.]
MENIFTQTFQNEVFTVTQLTLIIKDMIEGNFSVINLEGEISNYRPASSGHIYFSLKDDKSTISAVMFKNVVSKLNFMPHNGSLVRVKGKLSIYEERGIYQIIVSSMENAGTGAILQMLEMRKQQFASEGLFDSSRKKPIPFFPRKIGVVTSSTGAALQDILQIRSRRNNKNDIIIFPCLVQGTEAGVAIAKQIQVANTYNMCDVLIVGRGGGSLEDLLPFSEECVVRAIAASNIPVISAVGHEIDWALSDFVADMRAPTPSAAAELCTPLLHEIFATISETKNSLEHTIIQKLEKMRLLVKSFSAENLELRFRNIEQPLLSRFDDAKEILLLALKDKSAETRKRIEIATLSLNIGNPTSILARGYSMVRDKNSGKIIRSSKDTSSGRQIEIIPAEGKITATVN